MVAVDIGARSTPGGSAVVVAALTAGERRNALDLEVVDALTDLLRADPWQSVMLTSATPGIFCAGADLKISGEQRAAVSDRLYALYELMVCRPGLVVAAVDGPAVGGGAQLASAADFRVASPRGRFRWVGPKHGLVVGGWILPALVGRSRAMDLMLTGRWMELEEARAAGYVHRIADDPVSAALALVDELLQGRPSALARAKSLLSTGVLEALRAERVGNGDSWDGSVPDGAAQPGNAPPRQALSPANSAGPRAVAPATGDPETR